MLGYLPFPLRLNVDQTLRCMALKTRSEILVSNVGARAVSFNVL